jgi:hypothetical protein
MSNPCAFQTLPPFSNVDFACENDVYDVYQLRSGQPCHAQVVRPIHFPSHRSACVEYNVNSGLAESIWSLNLLWALNVGMWYLPMEFVVSQYLHAPDFPIPCPVKMILYPRHIHYSQGRTLNVQEVQRPSLTS